MSVVIIGAGPAGLTAACELAGAGVTGVVVLEATKETGGLARSVNYKGNRIDIGGHRFFSKSDWVVDWWLRMLPLAEECRAARDKVQWLTYRGAQRPFDAAVRGASRGGDMLVRSRLSRIYFGGQFFDYPLKADFATARKLGFARCASFAASYLWSRVFPRNPERSLEDFFINRFGRRLYLQFFKSYTEKVWGTPCSGISAQWGAQRVKSLSIGKALLHALSRPLRRMGLAAAKREPTSLIEHFLYPRLGPGQLWEVAAQKAQQLGVRLAFESPVVGLEHEGSRIRAVRVRRPDGGEERFEAATFVSTMALRDLVLGLEPPAPRDVQEVARQLEYRELIVVGLLYRRLLPSPAGRGPRNVPEDNWIYIQEPGMRVGRLQVLNNWSPHLVRDPDTVWIGMEYFCSQGDDLWSLSDEALIRLAGAEMSKLRMADPGDCIDSVVVRAPKAYPAYQGSYDRFGELRAYLDGFANLFVIGRNGMHRYNNQDHSMLCAKLAAEAIVAGSADKAPIWSVNVDDEYHEAAN